MPFSPETCSAELLQALKRLADERRTGLTLHHGSGPQARREYGDRGEKSPTEHLEKLGVLGPNVLLAHALGVDGAEVAGIAGAGGTRRRADLVLFDTRRPEWQALWNPLNNLIYNTDGRSVHTVVVDGRVVVDDYRQTFVDESRLFATVQEIGERLQARTGITFPRSRWPIL